MPACRECLIDSAAAKHLLCLSASGALLCELQALEESDDTQEAAEQLQDSSSFTVADLVHEALMDSLVGSADLDAQPEQLPAQQVEPILSLFG